MADSKEIKLILKTFKEGTGIEDAGKAIKGLQGEIGLAEKATGGLGKAFTAMLANPAFLTATAITAVVAALKKCIDEAAESEKSLNSLKASVTTTGGSWDVLSEQMRNYAGELQGITTYSDEQVMDVMQRLITVTGESKESWKAASLVLDIASTGMMGVEGAAKAVAMAMSGNVEALGRYIPELKGVNTEHLNGKTAAEKAEYALGLLNEKFGGRAQKDASTFKGELAKLWNQLSELAELVGGVLLPRLRYLLELVNKLVKAIVDWNTLLIGKTKEAIDGVVGLLKRFGIVSGEAKKKTEELKQSHEDFGKIAQATAGKFKLSAEDIKKAADETAKKIKENNDAITRHYQDKLLEMKASRDISKSEEIAYWTDVKEHANLQGEGINEINRKIWDLQKEKRAEDLKSAQSHGELTAKVWEDIGKSFRDNVVDKIVAGTLDIASAFDELKKMVLKAMLTDLFTPLAEGSANLGKTIIGAVTGGGSAAIGGGGAAGGAGAGAGAASMIGASLPWVAGAALAGAAWNESQKPWTEEQIIALKENIQNMVKMGKAGAQSGYQWAGSTLKMQQAAWMKYDPQFYNDMMAQIPNQSMPWMAQNMMNTTASSAGVNITINTMAYTGDDRSIRTFAREIDKALAKEQRLGRTVTV